MDEFTLSPDPLAQPFNFGNTQTPPFTTPTQQPKRGVMQNPQDRMQAMKLAIMLPLALKAGPGAVQGLLQGFAQHEQKQAADNRQHMADQRVQSQADWQQQYQQGQLDNQRLTQQRQFVGDFTKGLGDLDTPEAIKAYTDLYAKQGQAFGVTPDALTAYAAPYAEPTRLQRNAADRYVKKLKAEYGEKWMETGAQFTHRVGNQTLTFDQLMQQAGMEKDPSYAAPAAKPTDKRGFTPRDITLNGKRMLANFDPDTGQYYAVGDTQTPLKGDIQQYQRPPGSGGLLGGNTSSTNSDVEAIADAIVRGEQPPTTTGLYGKTAAVRAALAKRGYNLTTASLDYTATQAHFRTLNGAQQTRMRQAVDNAAHSLDVIDALAQQWQGGKYPLLNKGRLAAAKSGVLGAQAQTIATQLEAQISDVTSELGNVYMGGNSPTDHALALAAKNLSANWSLPQLQDALKLARTNLTIRQNSIQNTGAITATNNNPAATDAPQVEEWVRDANGKLVRKAKQ